MKKSLLFLILIFQFSAFSQEEAFVYFNAKQNAATYLANPLTMLTQRSLDRRTAQGIALDNKDVPMTQSYIDQVENSTGITVLGKSKWSNCVYVVGSIAQIQALTSFSFVDHLDFADHSLNNRPNATPKPFQKKPLENKFQPETIFNYGNSANQIEMLNGHLLHQQNYTGSGKIIAILDGGFPGVDTESPFARLRDNNKILGGYDFVSDDANFYTGITHGTLVLSTIGGYVDGQLVGTAPDASFYLFITEDGNYEGPKEEILWVQAAEEADRLGVDILSTSLGYSVGFDNPNYEHTYADMDGNTTFISKGTNIAFSRGMICVTSAGNSGAAAWHYITAPADAQNSLTVGAVNATENVASFSSRGPSFDGRVKPDVMAQGVASVLSNASGQISTANGTSFSCPITSGLVACLWQALPNKTNAEIVQLIKQSADRFSNPNDDYGYGIPNFSQALTNATLSNSSYSTSEFKVYPNPTNGVFNVNVSSDSKISIYNNLGQEIIEKNISSENTSISLSDYSNGIYFYKIESNTNSQTGKIIKN